MPSNYWTFKIVMAAAAFLFGLPFSSRSDTTGYWKFEEGDVGTVASAIQSEVNGSKLFGAASGHAGGLAPVYTSDVPGKTIRDGEEGKIINDNNTSSLAFVGGSKNAGGIVEIKTEVESEFLLQPKSFTIEAFVKTGSSQLFGLWFARDVTGAGSSWRIGPDWTQGMVSLTVSDMGQKFVQFRNPNVPSKAAMNHNLTWHHIAVTYDESSKTMTYFEDYQPRGKLILPADFELKYGDGALTIGDAGAQGNSYTGSIDEVRLSDKVLPPEKFLRAE